MQRAFTNIYGLEATFITKLLSLVIVFYIAFTVCLFVAQNLFVFCFCYVLLKLELVHLFTKIWEYLDWVIFGFVCRAQDLVALSGAHTLGSKGFGDPNVFDNSYFKILLEKPWKLGEWNCPRSWQCELLKRTLGVSYHVWRNICF